MKRSSVGVVEDGSRVSVIEDRSCLPVYFIRNGYGSIKYRVVLVVAAVVR